MEHFTPVSAPAPRSPVLVSGIPRRSFLFSRCSPGWAVTLLCHRCSAVAESSRADYDKLGRSTI